MAKKKQSEEEEVIVDIVGNYNQVERFIEEKKNLISYVAGAIVLIVGGYFAYMNLYLKPLEEEASMEMWKAQQYFSVDSLDKAMLGDGNYLGFEDIASEYSGTKAGELANYYLGLIYMKQGEYDIAIDYLSDFSTNDLLVSVVATGAIGDCWSEIGDLEEAYSYYVKAAKKNPNEFTTPVYLMKAGKVAENLGKYSEAADHYEEIFNEYPDTQEGREVEKYLYRAKTLAANS